MESTEAPLCGVFDTWTDDFEVGNFEDMPLEQLDGLLMHFHDVPTQPPPEPAKSPGNKSSPQHSSPSPYSGSAQYTPSSTNPEFSNESSFEADDGSFGESSVYTTSPTADGYVHVVPFGRHPADLTMTDQPPHSTSGEPSSLADRTRDPSITSLATPSHQQWTPVTTDTTMGNQDNSTGTGHQQGSLDYGLDDLSFFPNEDMLADMHSAAVFDPAFRLAQWPIDQVHDTYVTSHQQSQTFQPPAFVASQPLYPHQPTAPRMGMGRYGMATPHMQQLYNDSASLREQNLAAQFAYQRFLSADQSGLHYQQPPVTVETHPPRPDPHWHQEPKPEPASSHQEPSPLKDRQGHNAEDTSKPASERNRPSKSKPRTGGRQKNTHLPPHTRQKSSAMRKTGACWRCAMQRDQCDGNDPCSRCMMRWQKGQQYFFACDRSKLPDFVLDFLPPSMTLMHQKQTIEDCVQLEVRGWDFARPVDVYLTSGYGHALRWTLHEFEPASHELLRQYQYLQDPHTGLSRRYTKYSPPLGIIKLEPSDDTYFSEYLDELMADSYLEEFPWICFGEEDQINDFQSSMLAMMCKLSMRTSDYDLRELLRKIIRMMIITYIMGHTLTISEDTLHSVVSFVKHPRKPTRLECHTSPRLANRQLKFFFHVLRGAIYEEILKWMQATLHTSGPKDSTWLPAFCVMLGFGMVLEEVQRTIQIQADSKAQKGEKTPEEAHQEALNACERIDRRYTFLIGLFQCKYRDKKWTARGSFGNSTPVLQDKHEVEFLGDLYELLNEQKHHLRTREHVEFKTENQCKYTSRLVARFLLPFLGLPAQ